MLGYSFQQNRFKILISQGGFAKLRSGNSSIFTVSGTLLVTSVMESFFRNLVSLK